MTGTGTENVSSLPASTTFTPEQAIASAASLSMTEVLVIGYDEEERLVVRSSRMDRASALWLVEQARRWVLGDLIDG